MKAILCLIAATLFAAPVLAADVGVSVSIGDPGFYGRIDIGSAPPPRILYRDPVVIEHVHVMQPVYMRVPPGHARHWKDHCREYNACGQPVYFVQNDWYNDVYTPYYRGRNGHGGGHDNGGNHGNGHGKDKGNSGGHGKGNKH